MWALTSVFYEQGPRYVFLDEAGDAVYYNAVATHWAIENAIVCEVAWAVAHYHCVTHWQWGYDHAYARTNYLEAAIQCAVENTVIIDEAHASKVDYYTCWTTVETHTVVWSSVVATNCGAWHWPLNSRAMAWTAHFYTWPVAHCTATHLACHCRWYRQTCGYQDDCDA